MAGAADIEAGGQVGLHFRFGEGCTVRIAGLGKLIERADIASAAIELHRRQLASPARCGRLLAQTNPASAVMPTLPPGGPDGGVSRA